MNTSTNSPRFTQPEYLVQQRAIGALVGAAIADALGAPFEFDEPGRYEQRFPHPMVDGFGEMIGGGAFSWAPGEFTDDTQMMLALAESILDRQSFDPAHTFACFRTWSNSARDCGITTATALLCDDYQVAARQAHEMIGRTGSNGALMRTWPIALWHLNDTTESVMRVAQDQAALTHFDPIAGVAAAIGTELCRRAIHGGDLIANIDDVLTYVPEDARAEFARVLSSEWQPNHHEDASNGSAVICLAQAIWAIRHHNSFEDVVAAAINLGHDTDTVACVAGALAGAKYSVQSIPSRWIAYVNGSLGRADGVKSYRYVDLLNIARRLIGRGDARLSAVEYPIAAAQVVDDHHELYASDLGGALESDDSFATVSLCLINNRLDHHRVRRESHIIDTEGCNAELLNVVRDAVDSVDALLAAGHKVLVHCHGGRSRTGLVLKAWAIRRYGYTERVAHDWLQSRWDRYADYNYDFVDFLRTDWSEHCGIEPQE